LFCFVLLVCTVTNFSSEDKASGIKFCTAFIGVRGRESHILGNFAAPEARNQTNRLVRHHLHDVHNDSLWLLNTRQRTACGRRIGMCGYTAVFGDRRTCCSMCIFSITLPLNRVSVYCVDPRPLRRDQDLDTWSRDV